MSVLLEVRYRSLLALAADHPDELRRCDVFRVMDGAADLDLPGFGHWLVGLRPDLAEAVEEARADLAALNEEGA